MQIILLLRTLLVLLLIALPAQSTGPDAESLMNNGHWKRGRAVSEVVFRAKPNDARANYWMARVRRQFKLLDEAEKYAASAVRLDPKVSAYHRELAKVYFDQIETASIFTAIGLAKKSRAELDTASAMAPNDAAILYDQVLFFQQVPGIAGGDKRRAAQLANNLLQVDAARGYLALAYIARQEGHGDQLGDLYQKAAEANPHDYDAQINIASYFLAAQYLNARSAEQHALVALALNPDRVEGYRALAAAQIYQKRYGDAAATLRRAESAIGDDLSAYVSAARALLRDGAELSTAEAWLRKYLSESKEPEPTAPPLGAVHWSLGLVLEKLGRRAEAKSELEIAVRLSPEFEPARQDLKRFK
jgi:tetratricopeptide (TPR) repeat protein